VINSSEQDFESHNYSKVLVCVAWPYVNGDLHVGHLGGCLVPADIFARFHRLAGREVLMVSGSDCFGTPITLEADKRQISPSLLIDEYHPRIVNLYKKLCFSYDNYTKTDTPLHRRVTQELFLRLLKQGLIKVVTSSQYYSITEDRFLPDRYVEGTCPHCGYSGASSDQCDKCGAILTDGSLLSPHSKVSGSPVELRDSEQYAINWTLLQGFAESYFAKQGPKWRNWIQGETEKWLKEGLRPRDITRDIGWGVELPIEEIPSELHLKDMDRKRFYVWFDAVIGYLSASMEWEENKRASGEAGDWLSFWNQGSDVKHVYFMGKDNLIFHSVFWPGQINAYDKSLRLPDVLAINQFYRLNGEKFSKSKGIVLGAEDLVDQYGADAVRYYLAAHAPETADVDFTIADFITKTNAALSGNIGNFISRTIALALKIPAAEFEQVKSKFIPSDEIKEEVHKAYKSVAIAMEEVSTRAYCQAINELGGFANRDITAKAPWTIKDPLNEGYHQIILDSLYLVCALGLVLKPITVIAVAKLENLLGIEFKRFTLDEFSGNEMVLRDLVRELKISSKDNLFNRLE
jgi:methionyl-tRNA synthetase